MSLEFTTHQGAFTRIFRDSEGHITALHQVFPEIPKGQAVIGINSRVFTRKTGQKICELAADIDYIGEDAVVSEAIRNPFDVVDVGFIVEPLQEMPAVSVVQIVGRVAGGFAPHTDYSSMQEAWTFFEKVTDALSKPPEQYTTEDHRLLTEVMVTPRTATIRE